MVVLVYEYYVSERDNYISQINAVMTNNINSDLNLE